MCTIPYVSSACIVSVLHTIIKELKNTNLFFLYFSGWSLCWGRIKLYTCEGITDFKVCRLYELVGVMWSEIVLWSNASYLLNRPSFELKFLSCPTYYQKYSHYSESSLIHSWLRLSMHGWELEPAVPTPPHEFGATEQKVTAFHFELTNNWSISSHEITYLSGLEPMWHNCSIKLVLYHEGEYVFFFFFGNPKLLL